MKTWQKLRAHPGLWERYFVRERVITAIRTFFREQGFHEVETPLLTGSLPPESYLDVFETTLLDRRKRPSRAFLPTSPESFLKKLLVAGIGNCFTLTKSFRNTEGESQTHNPEFTILEWYRVNADYTDIMRDCEDLLVFINTYLLRSKQEKGSIDTKTLIYQGKKISLFRPWERITMVEACERYVHINLVRALERDVLAKLAKVKHYQVSEEDSWDDIFYQIFLNEIEPYLGRSKPTIIYDYPVQLAALAAKTKAGNPHFAERFEVYIGGIELADGCSELTEAEEQQKRFQKELDLRKKFGKNDYPVDKEFIEALKLELPTCAGVALGVDRLTMLFSDVTNIADTMFFPARDLF